ncbi:TetR/AcrR family transcriptional regulator [Microbacterium sp. NPDC091313]
MTRPETDRDRAKADRHSALLAQAARLFAERGFAGVSLEDLGAAVGVSGPAVYRHFANKQALLGALLVGVSESLRDGGAAAVQRHPDPRGALDALIAFHVEFALRDAEVIRVQDRDLGRLSDDDLHRVRSLQRGYVDLWVSVLARLRPDDDADDLRVRAHACFGLINSTPFSVRGLHRAPDDDAVRRILADMARAALGA